MRLLTNLKTYGTIITLTAALAPRVVLAQHRGGGMGGGGWMGEGGWTDMGGGMWLWTVVAVLAIVLLVVMISKQTNQK